MSIRSGQSIVFDFCTQSSTGAATNADSTPTGTVKVAGVDSGATVTITNTATGAYKAAFTCPPVNVGEIVECQIAATVGGVAAKAIKFRDVADLSINSSGKAAATLLYSDVTGNINANVMAVGSQAVAGLVALNLGIHVGTVPTASEWATETNYFVGDLVVSTAEEILSIQRCQVDHASGSGTMADDIAANPGYWTSAFSTTLKLDESAGYVNDRYNGMILVLYGESIGRYQAKVITDYDGASRTATLSSAFFPAVQKGSSYAVLPFLLDKAGVQAAMNDQGFTTARANKIDAIKDKTDNLPPDPADESSLEGTVNAVGSLVTALAGHVDNAVAPIKNKTDALPASFPDNFPSMQINGDGEVKTSNPAIQGGTGDGAYDQVIAVTDGTNVIVGAIIRFTDGVTPYEGTTGSDGTVVVSVNPGAYLLSVSKAGYQYDRTPHNVTSAGNIVAAMTPRSITPPADTDETVGVLTAYDVNNQRASGIVFRFALRRTLNHTPGASYSREFRTVTSGAGGAVVVNLLKNAVYWGQRQKSPGVWGDHVEFSTGSEDETPIAEILGKFVI